MDRGSYLKSLRLGKGMTQVEAGKLVGVDHSLIGKTFPKPIALYTTNGIIKT